MHKRKIYRWGILGTSKIGETLIPVINNSGCEITSIASRNLEKAKKYSKKNKIKKFYSSYEGLLRDKSIQIVYIPLPNSLHYKYIIKSLQNNKHVFCEKPICTNSEDLKSIIKIQKNKNLKVGEALMYRHHPQIKKLKEIILSNKLGKIKSLKGKFYYKYKNKNNIRFSKKLEGGSLWDLGYYIVSLINYLINEKITKIDGRFIKKYNNIDTIFKGSIYFENNINTEIKSSFEYNNLDIIEIICEKGKILVKNPFLRKKIKKIKIISKKINKLYSFYEEKHRYLYQIEDFIKKIESKKTLEVSLSESFKNIQITELLLSSAKKNKAILTK